jgi:type I restriction enzyme S subunit
MTERIEDWTAPTPVVPGMWEVAQFSDVFDVLPISGKKVPQKEYRKQGSIPVIDQGATFIGGHTDDESSRVKINSPVIVFGDHTRCFKLVNFDFAPGADGIKILAARNGIDSKFLYYACQILQLPNRGYSRHYSFLQKSKIPLAPLNEQRRIVSKIEELFSRLDEGEAGLRRVQRLLASYRQAVLKAAVTGELTKEWREDNQNRLESGADLLQRVLEARRTQWQGRGQYQEPQPPDITGLPELTVGWVYIPLSTACDIKGGETVDAKKRLSEPIEVPYLRVANVQDGYLDLEQIKTIKVEGAKIDDVLLRHGEILFTEGGDIDKLGRGWIWENQISPCTHQNHIFRARAYTEDINPKFVSYYCGVLGKEYFLREGKQTTNLASISMSKLRKFPIPLLDIAEQNEIVSQVDEILSQIAALKNWCSTELVRSTTLRQAILKAASSGKLVEQDPRDEPASALLQRIHDARQTAVTKTTARPLSKDKSQSPPKQQPTLWEPT